MSRFKKMLVEVLGLKRHKLPLQRLRCAAEKSVLKPIKKHFQDNGAELKAVAVNITSTCNGKCWFCPSKIISANREPEFMTRELFERIVNQLADMSYKGIFALGLQAEPFLHGRIVELVKCASSKLSDCEIQIISNGIAADPEVCAELLNLPNVYIYFNTHGNDEVINKFRLWPAQLVGFGDVILRHKRLIIDNRKEPRNIMNWAGQIPTRFKLPLNQFCMRPFVEMSIDYDGKALQCCADWKQENVLGDLNKESIEQIWRGFANQRLRYLLLDNKRWGLCSKCDYSGIINYLEKKAG